MTLDPHSLIPPLEKTDRRLAKEAHRRLDAFLQEYGPGLRLSAHRPFRDPTRPRRRNEWPTLNDFRTDGANWDDHAHRWTRHGRPAALTFQPYKLERGRWDRQETDRIAEGLAAHGYRLDVRPELSFWYPRSTLLLVVTRPQLPAPDVLALHALDQLEKLLSRPEQITRARAARIQRAAAFLEETVAAGKLTPPIARRAQAALDRAVLALSSSERNRPFLLRLRPQETA